MAANTSALSAGTTFQFPDFMTSSCAGERWRDSIPIAAILGDTYRIPSSPLSGASPPRQIGVDECFGRLASIEIRSVNASRPSMRRSLASTSDLFFLQRNFCCFSCERCFQGGCERDGEDGDVVLLSELLCGFGDRAG